jgi:membrane-associated phospholipid phosphatase
MDNIQNATQEAQQKMQVARRPRYLVLLQTRFLLSLYLVLLALFGILAFLVHIHPLLPVDVAITQEFQKDRSPWLSTFMVAVSYLGNAFWLFVGLIFLTAAAFWSLRLRLEAVILALICLTSSLLNFLVKLLVARPRPSQPLVAVLQYASGKSFPSGHVMAYVAYWGTLFTFSFILFHGKHWWRIALLLVSGMFVVLIGPSRIYLGDHWASDVLGAYLLGGLWLWAWLWVYTKLKEHHVLETPARVPATK